MNNVYYALKSNGILIEQISFITLAYHYFQYEMQMEEGDGLEVVWSNDNTHWFEYNGVMPPEQFRDKMPILLFKNGAYYFFPETGKFIFFGGKINVEEELFDFCLKNGRKSKRFLRKEHNFVVDCRDLKFKKDGKKTIKFLTTPWLWEYINEKCQ